MTTEYHSKFYAHQLTKRVAPNNAHQVVAALFALRSPLSYDGVLAEVAFGKTIEAGLILGQLWGRAKRHILCIVPALRCNLIEDLGFER